jgi:hypothetical protein
VCSALCHHALLQSLLFRLQLLPAHVYQRATTQQIFIVFHHLFVPAAADYLLCDQYIGVTDVSGVYPVTISGKQYQVRLTAFRNDVGMEIEIGT